MSSHRQNFPDFGELGNESDDVAATPDCQYGTYDERAISTYEQSEVARDLIIRHSDTSPGEQTEPVIIQGDGISMGTPIIRRRERPLTMRLVMLVLLACILVTGLFAATPLGVGAETDISAFQALAGAVVLHHEVSFHWYTAQRGDTIESVAAKLHVQIGGIYKLNNMLAGEEIGVGKAYKIPDDPYFGADYRPPVYLSLGGDGTTRFGSNWWNTVAGNPLPEAPCGPDGHGNPTAYQLQPPNRHSYWIRGFAYIPALHTGHTGVDLSTVEGNPITAAQDGQVIWAGFDATNGLGWSIKINHCHHLSTVYGHMKEIHVSTGAFVHAGKVIGLEGSTGNSQGPHLHYMVEWDNMWVDPMPYYGNSRDAICGA